ncbi:hypothetical protein LX64_00306 [Chitinophaga skermanii]|uniref:Short-subunit dehydrogenase n=1 Tax=Chitinophaga skermanii TaxID=331697 RepID=A0A327R201_9BACT|nr:SDR family oxidoreductase [Chitinophaga skermanii]RAJ10700.1 hypothetical protein LX64_00306 [Chitinophaga skermanii]
MDFSTGTPTRYALVTGATSGIGYELTQLLAKDGYNLIIVARNENRLYTLADDIKLAYGVEVTPLVFDLFSPAAPQAIYDAVQAMAVPIDILVNDAGQGEWGPFSESPLQRDLDIIQLNITSMIALTKLFLRNMIGQKKGKILLLGSEAASGPMPLLAVYAATKAFVVSFGMALANELKDTELSVTVLLPGATDTDFFHKAHQENTVTYRETALADPVQVAKDGYDALMKGESKVVSGMKTKWHVFMNNIMSDEMSADAMRKQNEPSTKDEGRASATHPASREERREIDALKGGFDGDL